MTSATSKPDTATTEMALATRLLHAVLTKTFLEIAVLCLVVSLAAYWYFNPQLRGAIDVANARQIAGWAADPRQPHEALEVHLFVDEKFAAAGLASLPRQDLVQAGATKQAAHGFSFALEPLRLSSGIHTIQVYAVRPATEGSRILRPLAEAPLQIQIP